MLAKSVVRDTLAEGDFDRTGGFVPEKLEGMTVIGGHVFIVNDNDGLDDNNGETQLLDLGDLFDSASPEPRRSRATGSLAS